MPHIFYKPVSRREFLRTTVSAGVAFVALGCATNLTSRKQEPAGRWAFLADTHIAADPKDNVRRLYPHQNLQKAVSDIMVDLPDGVVIAGDLARLEGKSGDYERLKGLLVPLAEKKPIFMALGNHDDRSNFLKAFTQLSGQKQSVPDKHVTVVSGGPVRVILLDSLLYVNKTPGLLGKAQRAWLREYLAKSDGTPTILCFHHTMRDRDGDLLDVPRLFELIKPIRKVKAIVYGHSHEFGYSEFEGIHLINVPAAAYSFDDKVPVGWVEASLTARGGRFVLHAVAGNVGADKTVKNLAWRA